MSTDETTEGKAPEGTPARNLLADLNLRQAEAVAAPAGPVLVMAGPGSGKTRILTYRAAWLVEHEGAQPKEVLCVTFTNRAAEEMRVRLEELLGERGRDLRIHTFHALCARILRQYATEIGLDPHFIVADEEHQVEMLTGIMRRAGLSLEQFPPYRVIDFISEFKRGLKDPAQAAPDERIPPEFVDIAEAYGLALRERKLLDFDDLIGYAVRLLAKNRVVRAAVQQQIPHVLVDEYQDIDSAQFELLRLIAPKGSDVLAVADDAQSIYGWRGAQPELIDAYVQFYRPRIVELEESYRSTENILYAAQNMLRIADRERMRRRRFLKTRQGSGSPIYHYIFATGRQEQAWVARLIRRLVEGGEHGYGDIAVLYRTHQLADEVEGALIEAQIPVQRVRKDSFFSEPLPREVVRYLHLVHSLTSDNLLAAFNFPQTLADELTVLQLQTLSNIHRLPLSEVARRSDSFPELSPLTRANLAEFMRLFEEELVPRAERGAAEAVTALFEALGRRRSPFTSDEFRSLRDAAAFFRFAEAAAALRDHLTAYASARLIAPATADGACAAAVLQGTVERYLGATLEVELRGALAKTTSEPDGPAGASPAQPGHVSPGDGDDYLELVLGELGERRVIVRPPAGGSLRYSLSEAAWRLAQDLLVAHETLAAQPIVIYDLETTGTDVKRDEIVEIGAQRWEGGEPSGPAFYSLVRPGQAIPREATLVHGIRNEDVRGAEPIGAALPKFLRYVGPQTVAGHNIIRFDNRIMDRETGRLLRRGFPNPAVDTLEMAKRLYEAGSGTPESYSLEALLRRHHLGENVAHRAAGDVAQIGALYRHLLKENSLQLALRSLPEYLPLAAAGMAAAGAGRRDENAAIWNGARRMAARLGDVPGLETARRLLASALSREAELAASPPHSPTPSSLGHEVSDALAALAALEAAVAGLADGEPLPEDEDWAALRERFTAQVATFDRFTNDHSLRAFLDYQALVTSLDTTRLNRAGRVTLMTLHNAKGTEYPVIIIVGVEEDNLPLWTAHEDPRRLAEERRVFYVGLTRAQKRLYLTSVRRRGESGLRTPSRFAFELPSRYVRRLIIGPRGEIKQLR